jgi:hypothetical protein
MIQQKEELRRIYLRYSEIYEEMKGLEEKALELSNLQRSINQKLSDTREEERATINKIEEELGRSLTQTDLLEMIRNHAE